MPQAFFKLLLLCLISMGCLLSACLFVYLFIFNFYLFMIEREREAETQAEGEAGSMHRESDVGFDPGSPGSRPGPKAGAKPLRHPGIPCCLFKDGDSAFYRPLGSLRTELTF